MKSLVFYGSQTRLSVQHNFVPCESGYWLRVESVNMAPNEALTHAVPILGETVLNAVQLIIGDRCPVCGIMDFNKRK